MDTSYYHAIWHIESMRLYGEICDGMQALTGKLNHLGLDKSPAKSTAGDGLRGRDNDFFKDVYFMLLEHFKSILSVMLFRT